MAQERNIVPYPVGPLLWLVRLPIWLYELGLGPLLGWVPYSIVTTRGWKTGKPRHVVLEYRRHGSKFYVISGWGKRPHWYRNLIKNPLATMQYGDKTIAVRATPVDDPAEALRVLHMFGKRSPVTKVILSSMNSAGAIDLKTLTQVAGEFTVVRLDVMPGNPALPGVQAKQGWQKTILIAAIALLVIGAVIRMLAQNNSDSSG